MSEKNSNYPKVICQNCAQKGFSVALTLLLIVVFQFLTCTSTIYDSKESCSNNRHFYDKVKIPVTIM